MLGFWSSRLTETTLTNCGFLGELVLTCPVDAKYDLLEGVLVEDRG